MSLYSSILEDDQDDQCLRNAACRAAIGKTCDALKDQGYEPFEIVNSMAAMVYATMVETMGQEKATERWIECCKVMNGTTTH